MITEDKIEEILKKSGMSRQRANQYKRSITKEINEVIEKEKPKEIPRDIFEVEDEYKEE